MKLKVGKRPLPSPCRATWTKRLARASAKAPSSLRSFPLPGHRSERTSFPGTKKPKWPSSGSSIHASWASAPRPCPLPEGVGEKAYGGISFPLLSDSGPLGAVARKYGVKEGFSERAIFV